jgi:hypothetical protein
LKNATEYRPQIQSSFKPPGGMGEVHIDALIEEGWNNARFF